MVEFKIYYSFKKVKKLLNGIMKDSNDIYPQQRFLKICYQYRRTSLSNIKNRDVLCVFVVCYVDDKPICIAPLNINKKEKIISLLGHGSNAKFLDFIYDKTKRYAYVAETFEFCREKYRGYDFDFNFVPDYSPLVLVMNKQNIYNNYAIKMDSYEKWFSSLSKSMRQNIRTAYNRVNTDSAELQYAEYKRFDRQIEKVISQCNELYQKRRLDWIEEQCFPGKFKMMKIQKRDIVYQTIRKFDESITAVLYINNKIAAFFMGYENDQSVQIPRLAINTEFARYSPGIILINEYLKEKADGTSFVFDLSRGDEDYKQKLNGEVSETYRLSKTRKDDTK